METRLNLRRANQTKAQNQPKGSKGDPTTKTSLAGLAAITQNGLVLEPYACNRSAHILYEEYMIPFGYPNSYSASNTIGRHPK